MTLRSDLTALLANAGLVDVDIDEAFADEHVRSAAYRRVVAVAAAGESRDADRELVAALVRDPDQLAAKSAVVELVDRIAAKAASPDAFRQWADGILPVADRLPAEGNRAFVRRRVGDWLLYLSVKAGAVPTEAELAAVTPWMQRLLAEESTSRPVLALLAESGHTRKIRNIAKNRA
ncbi:hypothetical protein ACFVYA_08260 [Amycolatopsis sp. NPDC058278]|uniref:hypothetical protein n=1 Tax=Amycolatopsis sp. NPDC058278 TaxID=3346417 RepID=UPI0036D8D943